jgi:predicted metal-dependent hydrolase
MQLLRQNRRHYQLYKEDARVLAHARLAHFNTYYQVSLRRIFIKNLKSRWGSCSEKGNLNFNYKILFLPLAVADYVVVHELCHLREFNHSLKFWSLVAETIPNHKEMRRQLRALERGK